MKDYDIVDEAVFFFSSLLSRDHSLSLEDQDVILDSISSLIQDHHNSFLKAIPSSSEIAKIVFLSLLIKLLDQMGSQPSFVKPIGKWLKGMW